MMKKPVLLLLLTALLSPRAWAAQTREPQVAGSFYPANAAELSRMLDGYLAAVPKPPDAFHVRALIAPHAGYLFSGPVAAQAYKRLEGNSYDTVVILGPFHSALFPGASVWSSGSWKTPLGSVEVDSELARAILAENPSFGFFPQAHLGEHSIEMQIPFLQKVLRGFKIVPIAVSDPSPQTTGALARALFKHLAGKNTLVVASTDLSHYRPAAEAGRMDSGTLEAISRGDAEALRDRIRNGRSELCGDAAVLTLLELARLEGDEVRILRYGDSGDVTGEKVAVVGYGAALFFHPEPPAPAAGPGGLPEASQRELLGIARRTLEQYLANGTRPEIAPSDPALKEPRAAFVTLRKQGALRGCIGHTLAQEPLALAVRDLAVESATHDPRFPPVRADELGSIRIEISVLSAPRKIDTPGSIVMGRDGVLLKQGGRGGVFLPDVAKETGWTREEFLSQLCSEKAGLPANCWKDPTTELYTFTAQDFMEPAA